MSRTDALCTYLDDHLAGATAGVELARRTAASHAGTAAQSFLETLAEEIAADRETLLALFGRLDIEPSRAKAAAGWVGEKFSRLKLSEAATGDENLTRLLELETLSLGIAGKLALWRSLRASMGEELNDMHLDELIRRAERQRDGVEHCRLDAAGAALKG